MLCGSARALPTLSARFSSVEERVQKAEPKRSAPQSRGKACRHLSSVTEEEMKRSRGRIRDLRLKLAWKRAERNRRNRRASDYLQECQRDRQAQPAAFSLSSTSFFLLLTASSRTDLPSSQHTGLFLIRLIM
jgi:hypothetical protein